MTCKVLQYICDVAAQKKKRKSVQKPAQKKTAPGQKPALKVTGVRRESRKLLKLKPGRVEPPAKAYSRKVKHREKPEAQE